MSAPPTPAVTPEPVPVSAEIVAWRGWKIWREPEALLDYVTGKPADGPPVLTSMNGVVWSGPTLTAHKLPNKEDGSGIYAMTLAAIKQVLQYSPHAIGEVALSGLVLEGERGYRAERATIRSLYVYNETAEVVAAMSQRYAVETVVGFPNGWYPEPTVFFTRTGVPTQTKAEITLSESCMQRLARLIRGVAF